MATKKKPGKPAKSPKSAFRTLREFSAGGLIWRRPHPDGKAEVVLVRPAGKETWVMPKGGLESKESIEQAAMRECEEETGFKVSIDRPLGQVAYFYARRESPSGPMYRIFKRVNFFLMRHLGGDASQHDDEIQDVKWFGIEDAVRKASHRNERELILKAASLLDQPGGTGS
ncbi:MAG TPA: NUDIX domain-containing protein [Candidatus Binataceae bacterium]|jgi:8-oxo-dGTP pyrophosphatase MutT (NUDIX family)|nr:NUDIX domain-containing protein [Candidatus Binataceae bacterium]